MKTWKRLLGYLLQQKSSAPRGLDFSDSEQIHPHSQHGLKIAPKTGNFSISLGLRSCYFLILVLCDGINMGWFAFSGQILGAKAGLDRTGSMQIRVNSPHELKIAPKEINLLFTAGCVRTASLFSFL